VKNSKCAKKKLLNKSLDLQATARQQSSLRKRTDRLSQVLQLCENYLISLAPLFILTHV
jgi:hypothetical protein